MNTNKKFISLCLSLLSIVLVSTILSSCQKRQTLLFLNWGEYINDDLITKFEEEYNCNLIVDLADSNELFYSKLKSGTTAYDLCCPADYMVEKMYLSGLIQEIDFNKIPLYSPSRMMDGVMKIEEGMNESMKTICIDNGLKPDYDYEGNEINKYHMPYFWGTFGLLYSQKKDDKTKYHETFKDEFTYKDYEIVLDDNGSPLGPDGYPDILQKSDPWKVYFRDKSLSKEDSLPDNVAIGMYDAVRFSYGCVMTYYASNPNVALEDVTNGKKNVDAYRDILTSVKYKEFGGDTLKKGIESGNLGIAFAYTGDCLDMCYLHMKEDENTNFEDLDFFVYVPDVTMAHIDTLVIPSNARHVDLAHEFLNFLQRPENVWLNARDVGYCPPLQEVYDWIVNEQGPEGFFEGLSDYEVKEELRWRSNWSKTIKKAFPIDDRELNPFSFFETSEITRLQNIVNNIKVG